MAKHLPFPVIALWVKYFLQSGELICFVLKNVFICISCLSYFSKIFLILFHHPGLIITSFRICLAFYFQGNMVMICF